MIITLDLHETRLPDSLKMLFDDIQLECEELPLVGDYVNVYIVGIDFINEYIVDGDRLRTQFSKMKNNETELSKLKVKARVFSPFKSGDLKAVELIF